MWINVQKTAVCLHWLRKSWTENFILCVVSVFIHLKVSFSGYLTWTSLDSSYHILLPDLFFDHHELLPILAFTSANFLFCLCLRCLRICICIYIYIYITKIFKVNTFPCFDAVTVRDKCPNKQFFLVCIFPHSDWIWREEYLSALSPNAVKYGPEKAPYLDTSRSVSYGFHNIFEAQVVGFSDPIKYQGWSFRENNGFQQRFKFAWEN